MVLAISGHHCCTLQEKPFTAILQIFRSMVEKILRRGSPKVGKTSEKELTPIGKTQDVPTSLERPGWKGW